MSSRELLKSWVNYATPKARNIVRSVLAARKDVIGLSTQDIFREAHERFPEVYSPAPPEHTVLPGQKGKFGRPPKAIPDPPKREHPIRSVKYLKKIVLEDLAHRGEIEKIHIKRGTGGEDEQGNKLDFVSRKGLPRSPAKTGIVSKQAWVWQLKEIPPLDPMTSAAPEKPNIEEEEEDDDLFLASPEGWTKKNLRFVNVKHVDLKRYEAPA